MAEKSCAVEGCPQPGTKLCSRCGSVAYCSADCQRKDWKIHKLVCQKVETPETRITELLKTGRLFSAKEELSKLPKPNKRLLEEWSDLQKAGIHSEVVAERLNLKPIDGCGLGYMASKDISAGEVLFFDTAYCSAPIDGEKEYFYLIAEKAIRKGHRDRRSSARADAQADFYYDAVLKLGTKDNHDRATLDDTSIDADMKEQILVCSIAEANCLFCTEEPNFVALFAAAAHFNHSCTPNASVESSRTSIMVRAKTAIAQGKEVTISYLPTELLEEDREKRQQRLEAGRGFRCRCERCCDEAEARKTIQSSSDRAKEHEPCAAGQ
mmetsp:Transcript_36694/g.84663  ORF Transcript_36694/g.84663 Transcript_36694/m.84663 type:complete len:324 (-) Transcript_36694:21-992(-)